MDGEIFRIFILLAPKLSMELVTLIYLLPSRKSVAMAHWHRRLFKVSIQI